MTEFRNEHKYLINECQKEILHLKARQLMRLDSHTGSSGFYNIRSLYFDDLDGSSFYETVEGYDNRNKYRIRIYNGSPDVIHLERKSKINGMTRKTAAPLPRELCDMMIKGQIPPVTVDMNDTLKELLTDMRLKNMRPAIIVEYDRIPFVYSTGNVRVTFDTNISSGSDINSFLNRSVSLRPVLEKGSSILEVKWDELFPLHLKECLNFDFLQRTSFSKYVLCRLYNTKG